MRLLLVRSMMVLAALAAAPASADPVPFVTGSCDTAAFGSTSPSGITYNASLDSLLVVDPERDLAFHVDRDCRLVSSFSLSALGSTLATGVAYDIPGDRYAITDTFQGEVYFVSPTGVPQGSCDLPGIGVVAPFGISYDPSTDTFAIVSDATDELVRIDDSVTNGDRCGLVDRSTLKDVGIESPAGLVFLPGESGLAVVDFDDDQVYQLALDLQPESSFDTARGVGATQPSGITFVPSEARYYLVDGESARLFGVDARGTSEFLCSTDAIPVIRPWALAYNEALNELVIVENEPPRSLLFVDAATCRVRNQISLTDQGIFNPQDIAYNPDRAEILVVDGIESAAYFLDYATGLVRRRCDIGEFGIRGGSGAAVVSALDWFIVFDPLEDAYVIIDAQCEFVAQHSLELEFPEDLGRLTYLPRTGRWLAWDGTRYQVYEGTLAGDRGRDFDTEGLDLITIQGFVALSSDTFVVADRLEDGLFTWHIPLLAEAQSLDGSFRRGASQLTLFEQGGGYVAGVLSLPFAKLPTFGFYEAQTRSLTLTLKLPGGSGTTVTGAVSADLESLTLPPPFGSFERQP